MIPEKNDAADLFKGEIARVRKQFMDEIKKLEKENAKLTKQVNELSSTLRKVEKSVKRISSGGLH